MARGWESKSVESQQDDAARNRARPRRELTPAARARLAERRAIELARARVAADLQKAAAPAHRAMLEQALQALDEQIRTLDAGSTA